MVFGAKWCKPCIPMHAVVRQLRDEGFLVYYVDIDEHTDDLKGAGIKLDAIPTTYVYDKGNVVKTFTSFTAADVLREHLSKPKTPDYNLGL